MLVFALIMLAVIGWWVGAFLLYSKQKKKRTGQRWTWPVCQGVVKYAKIKHFAAEGGGDNAKPEEWTVYVEFSYDVGGKTYSSSQEWDSYQSVSQHAYYSGSPVSVYYNPVCPKESVVNPTKLGDFWIGHWLFATAVILPIILFIVLAVLLTSQN